MFKNYSNDKKTGAKSNINKISLIEILTEIAIVAAEEIIKTTTLTMEEAIEIVVSSLRRECQEKIKKLR